VRTATVEAQARATWCLGTTVMELECAAGISRSTAGKYRKMMQAEDGEYGQFAHLITERYTEKQDEQAAVARDTPMLDEGKSPETQNRAIPGIRT
jgi:hypothetical protein